MKANTMGAEGVAQSTQAAAGEFGDRMRDAGDTLKQSTEKMAETGTALGMKMLDQAESNAREAFAAMRAAAQAKDVSEVVKIQGDYLREQSSRAMTQAREIAELITGFGRDAIGQMSRRG
ncbi:MAG: phasin family protein [Sphingomonas sp.]|nr:phasin family protein [Sphingomonas sp.]